VTLQKSGPHAKPRWLALLGTVTLLAGLMAGSASAASPTVSISDYSQCPDGTANDDFKACLSTGWILGILNAQNSTYHEDEVTPQRLLLAIPVGASMTNHSVDITYLTRKGSASAHAYDSLATWNYTQTAAEHCQLLSNCSGLSGPTYFAMPADTTAVPPASGGASTTTSTHELTGDNARFAFFGDVLNAAAGAPLHTANVSSSSTDDYATVRVSYNLGPSFGNGTTVTTAGYVQLLFGGHLAASGYNATTDPRGWGGALGASNINGGPYHIRITNLDGASIGNRDNQIAAGSILPFVAATPGISTTPSATTTFSATLDDSATITGGNSPTGSLVFKLYASSADCIADTNVLYTDTEPVAGNATYSTTTSTATSGSKVVTAAGTYYWGVSYSGDLANTAVPAACDETETVTGSSVSP
jgi:hypothetical protein